MTMLSPLDVRKGSAVVWLVVALGAGCRAQPLEAREEPVSQRELEQRLTPPTPAASLPVGFVEDVIVTNLFGATAMAFAPDGRLFVAVQTGQLRVIKNGSLLPGAVLSLNVDSIGERGLLGVAVDPSFAANGFVYLYYTTATAPIHNRLSRFTVVGDSAALASETVLMDLENLGASNHNGGAVHFGPDNKLYVAVGENAITANAQTLTNRLGKLLRINADGSIPSDNPFFATAVGANRSIWALGLRNPFTFAFQRGTGRLFINDVGANLWEEINDGVAGSNYGWPTTEGPTSNPSFRSPLHAYSHSGGACAITGGAFYNPALVTFPSPYVGRYFFADSCASWIKTYNPSTGVVVDFATGAESPVDLVVHTDGALYYLARGNGSVRRVRSTTPPASAVPAVPYASTLLLALGLGLFGMLGLLRRKAVGG